MAVPKANLFITVTICSLSLHNGPYPFTIHLSPFTLLRQAFIFYWDDFVKTLWRGCLLRKTRNS